MVGQSTLEVEEAVTMTTHHSGHTYHPVTALRRSRSEAKAALWMLPVVVAPSLLDRFINLG